MTQPRRFRTSQGGEMDCIIPRGRDRQTTETADEDELKDSRKLQKKLFGTL
jgi:hypothetical protein